MPDVDPSDLAHHRLVAQRCTHLEGELRALRAWAWDRGRTDIVLALDQHARGWRLIGERTRENVVALAAITPPDGELGRRLHRIAAGGGGAGETAGPASELAGWCHERCLLLDGALEEMRASASPGA
jgi:hypothetical protein